MSGFPSFDGEGRLQQRPEQERICRVDGSLPGADEQLARHLLSAMRSRGSTGKPPVAFCIGTDRSTGDALGPLTGEFLRRFSKKWKVLGSLAEPVHACNLSEAIERLRSSHAGSIVFAVDACLGRTENVGSITLGSGPLRPGAGVNKTLPAVGDFYVTGTVNIGGFMEYFVLQNTRLSLVYRLSEVIARAMMAATGEADAFPGSQQSIVSGFPLVDEAAVAATFPGK